jgi:hypothetical protein
VLNAEDGSASAWGDTDAPEPGTLDIQRVPFSELQQEFVQTWGWADPNDPQPEFVEIIGPTGSGKTHVLCKILQDRMLYRNSRTVLVVTKQDDAVFAKILGWPVVRKFSDIRKHRQVIYWPATKELGAKREAFHEKLIYELLTRLWKKNAWIIVAFDEIAYAEELSPRVKKLIRMYWREGRSLKITLIAMKQRPMGVARDMHSESQWTIEFKPKDEDDAKRYAELLGSRREWLPVLQSLNRANHEFVIQHAVTGDAFISWIDKPVRPITPPSERKRW